MRGCCQRGEAEAGVAGRRVVCLRMMARKRDRSLNAGVVCWAIYHRRDRIARHPGQAMAQASAWSPYACPNHDVLEVAVVVWDLRLSG
jgi:hypothetical protein